MIKKTHDIKENITDILKGYCALKNNNNNNLFDTSEVLNNQKVMIIKAPYHHMQLCFLTTDINVHGASQNLP